MAKRQSKSTKTTVTEAPWDVPWDEPVEQTLEHQLEVVESGFHEHVCATCGPWRCGDDPGQCDFECPRCGMRNV